jgi:enoyl-CoA hydratase
MNLQHSMTSVTGYADGKLLAGRLQRIGIVLFNQPEKHNAINVEMWQGLATALDEFAADDDIRVVVYAGAGGQAFTSGADISQFAARRDNARDNDEFMRMTAPGRDRLATFPKPSIACIEGYCLGGGLAVALQADLRMAAADAVLGVPAARLGIAYAMQPTKRLVDLVGPAQARLLLYTARRFSAHEAFAIGLVDSVVEAQQAEQACVELANTIAENAPLSVAAAKLTIDQIVNDASERDLARVAEAVRRCMDSADYREGREAFAQKRKPVFTGA